MDEVYAEVHCATVNFLTVAVNLSATTIRQLLCEMDLMTRYVQKHPSAARKQWQKTRSGCN
jgi:hypothetical protein